MAEHCDAFTFSDAKKRLTFRVTPKAMSSSGLKIYFECIGYPYDDTKHMHQTRMRSYKSSPHNPEYTKVQIVRNPYTRVVSSYLHIVQHNLRSTYQNKLGFKDFLKTLTKISPDTYDTHTIFQYANFEPDFLIRVENLKEDIDYINEKTNLNFGIFVDKIDPNNIRFFDKSADKPIFLGGEYVGEMMEFIRSNRNNTKKDQKNNFMKNYQQFYDEENIKLVEQIYAKDINRFNYTYPFDGVFKQ